MTAPHCLPASLPDRSKPTSVRHCLRNAPNLPIIELGPGIGWRRTNDEHSTKNLILPMLAADDAIAHAGAGARCNDALETMKQKYL